MNVQIEPTWKEYLQGEFEKPYFEQLTQSVRQEYTAGTCYPPGRFIFNAFNLCPFNQVKVVIIGQDPYHEPGQAHGLSFSVQDGVQFPPSLQNIFKEIEQDLGTPIPTSGKPFVPMWQTATLRWVGKSLPMLLFRLWLNIVSIWSICFGAAMHVRRLT